MKPTTLAEVRTLLEKGQKRFTERLAAWKARVESDPVSAFRWSSEAFEASVYLWEIDHLLASFEKRDKDDPRSDEEVIAFLADHYGRQAIAAASHVVGSPSSPNTIVDDHQRAMLATFYGYFSGIRSVSSL